MAGKVGIYSDRGKLRLRWRYQNKTKSLSLGLDDTKAYRRYARSIQMQIEEDLMSGDYDESLLSYQPKVIGNSPTNIEATKLFEKYRQSKSLSIGTEQKYNAVATHLDRFFAGDLAGRIDGRMAGKFRDYLLRTVSPDTARTYLWLVRDCWLWAKGLYSVNDDIWKIRDIKSGRVIKRTPFDEAEVEAILKAFQENKYYAHYYPFMVAMFSTACRPGELADLKWSDVPNSNDKFLVWSNKTQRNRVVWIPSRLSELMAQTRREKTVLVFPSPTGIRINTGLLNKRGWKTILTDLDIEFRPIYTCRHTAISIALSKGARPIDVADQAGNRLDTTIKHYASSILQKPIFGADLNKKTP